MLVTDEANTIYALSYKNKVKNIDYSGKNMSVKLSTMFWCRVKKIIHYSISNGTKIKSRSRKYYNILRLHERYDDTVISILCKEEYE